MEEISATSVRQDSDNQLVAPVPSGLNTDASPHDLEPVLAERIDDVRLVRDDDDVGAGGRYRGNKLAEGLSAPVVLRRRYDEAAFGQIHGGLGVAEASSVPVSTAGGSAYCDANEPGCVKTPRFMRFSRCRFSAAAEGRMKRFVEGTDRGQGTLFPECLEDWIDENNPVRVIDVFVDELDLAELGFDGVAPEVTGRPAYHPSVLLKLYIYGYLNRVQSSRRLEREAGRNVEVMWLVGRLAPDHKTIADFRKDNGGAIRQVCARFIVLCRAMDLLTEASVAIDGSKFKAVNNRDKNFTRDKMDRRMSQIEESVARYLQQLDTADRQEPSEALKAKTNRLKDKIAKLKQQMQHLKRLQVQMLAAPDQQISLTDPDARSMATSGRGSGVVGYNVQVAVEIKHHPDRYA